MELHIIRPWPARYQISFLHISFIFSLLLVARTPITQHIVCEPMECWLESAKAYEL